MVAHEGHAEALSVAANHNPSGRMQVSGGYRRVGLLARRLLHGLGPQSAGRRSSHGAGSGMPKVSRLRAR